MKNNSIVSRSVLTESGYIVFILLINYLVIFYLYSDWVDLLINVTVIPFSAISLPTSILKLTIGCLVWLWLISMGISMTTALLSSESDLGLKWVTAVAFGVGFFGWVSMLLAIFNKIYVTILLLSFIIPISAIFLYIWCRKLVKKFLHLLIIVPVRFIGSKKFFAAFPFLVIYIFIVLHAVFTPVMHWDATVYHATMANIIYLYHGIPLIAGVSHGLEMSANYPPLFSAFGAIFYIITESIDDIWIKMISPIASFITILAVYQIGKYTIGPLYGLLSSLFLVYTPLFILYSIYETSYMLYISFLTMSTLYLLLALEKNIKAYYFLSGAFYGFALSTNYEALIISPLYLSILFYIWIKRRKIETILLTLSIFCFGSPWFLRNWLLLGNPIFPFGYEFFGGKFVSESMRKAVFDSIWKTSVISFFNTYNPNLTDYMRGLIFNRVNYPAYSFLLPVGAWFCITKKKTNFYVLIAWLLSCILPVLVGFKWIFPRAFLSSLIPSSFFTAYPIYKVIVVNYKHTANIVKTKLSLMRQAFSMHNAILALLLLIILAHCFFPAMTTAIAGKSTYDAVHASPPTSPFSLLGVIVPEWYHGQHRLVWEFLNANLREGNKVATMESKLYYIKHGDPKYFFPLDGFKAEELYRIASPEECIKFLRTNNVTYIYDSPWTRDVLWIMLPLTKYLGSPWFPLIYAVNPTTVARDVPAIYQVGPYKPISIKSDDLAVSLNGFWRLDWDNGIPVAIAISEKNDVIMSDAPRIYIEAIDPVIVRLEYLDVGTDWVDLHLYDPVTGRWYYSYVKIPRQNTYLWRNFTFIVPPSAYGFVTLGIHAYITDFKLREIEVIKLHESGKCSYLNPICTFTNTTVPPTIVIYIPILTGSETIFVKVSAQKNVSIEIFEGVIQPWETTKWWERHRMVSRVPELPVFGARDPSLVWKASAGIYTLVVVLWDKFEPGVGVDLSIVIGGSK